MLGKRMSPPGEARAVLIGTVASVVVLLLFVLRLGAVVLVSHTSNAPNNVVVRAATDGARLSRTHTTTPLTGQSSTSVYRSSAAR